MGATPVKTRVLVYSLGVVAFVEAAAAFSASRLSSPLWILAGARGLETVLILVGVSIHKAGVQVFGLSGPQCRNGLKQGLVWSALFGLSALIVATALLALHIPVLPFVKTTLPGNETKDLVAFFLVGALVAPVAEEVFFRGIVYGYLRRWGVFAAVAGSTALFVGAHGLGTRIPLTQLVGGVVFALAYETGGSLMAPVTIHVLGNAAIFALSVVV